MAARDTHSDAAAPLSRAVSRILLLMATATATAACGDLVPMDSESGTVVITGREQAGVPGPEAGAAPEQQVEAGAGLGADSGAGSGAQAAAAQQAPPSSATLDSLAAQLSDITAAQQMILSRLDAMEQGGTVAAAPDDTAGVALDLEDATEEVRSLGVGIFWSLVIIVVFHFLIRALAWILETLAERSVRRRLTFKWLIPITRMALWGIAAYLILRTVFRVDAQGLLAASAALGLALGIAAQDLLKNIFGGLIVVLELSPGELRQVVLARHRLSGLPLRFAEPHDGRAALRRRTRRLRGAEKQERLVETDYFQRLHRASQGSIRMALFHWLRSADSPRRREASWCGR